MDTLFINTEKQQLQGWKVVAFREWISGVGLHGLRALFCFVFSVWSLVTWLGFLNFVHAFL